MLALLLVPVLGQVRKRENVTPGGTKYFSVEAGGGFDGAEQEVTVENATDASQHSTTRHKEEASVQQPLFSSEDTVAGGSAPLSLQGPVTQKDIDDAIARHKRDKAALQKQHESQMAPLRALLEATEKQFKGTTQAALLEQELEGSAQAEAEAAKQKRKAELKQRQQAEVVQLKARQQQELEPLLAELEKAKAREASEVRQPAALVETSGRAKMETNAQMEARQAAEVQALLARQASEMAPLLKQLEEAKAAADHQALLETENSALIETSGQAKMETNAQMEARQAAEVQALLARQASEMAPLLKQLEEAKAAADHQALLETENSALIEEETEHANQMQALLEESDTAAKKSKKAAAIAALKAKQQAELEPLLEQLAKAKADEAKEDSMEAMLETELDDASNTKPRATVM